MEIDPQPLLPKPLILAVDDSPDSLLLIQGVLECSYQVRLVDNGQQALQAAVTEPRPPLAMASLAATRDAETGKHLRRIRRASWLWPTCSWNSRTASVPLPLPLPFLKPTQTSSARQTT